MLLDCFRGPHRFADVPEAGDASDNLRVDAMRRDVPLVDAPVLEAHDVHHFGRGIAPDGVRLQQHPFEILELRAHGFDEAVDASTFEVVGCQAEHLQVLTVVQDDVAVEVDHENAIVRRFERRLEQRDGFFQRGTIRQISL